MCEQKIETSWQNRVSTVLVPKYIEIALTLSLFPPVLILIKLVSQLNLSVYASVITMIEVAVLVALTSILVLMVHDIFVLRKHTEQGKKLQREAYTDANTKLLNRRYLDVAVPACIDEGTRFSFCYLDLDHLKQVNDGFGHEEGDRYIQRFIEEIRSDCRPSDSFVRIGGDEFVLVLPNCNELNARKKLMAIRDRLVQERCAYPMSFSFGIEYVDGEEHTNLETLLAITDQKMYEYKKCHHNMREEMERVS